MRKTMEGEDKTEVANMKDVDNINAAETLKGENITETIKGEDGKTASDQEVIRSNLKKLNHEINPNDENNGIQGNNEAEENLKDDKTQEVNIVEIKKNLKIDIKTEKPKNQELRRMLRQLNRNCGSGNASWQEKEALMESYKYKKEYIKPRLLYDTKKNSDLKDLASNNNIYPLHKESSNINVDSFTEDDTNNMTEDEIALYKQTLENTNSNKVSTQESVPLFNIFKIRESKNKKKLRFELDLTTLEHKRITTENFNKNPISENLNIVKIGDKFAKFKESSSTPIITNNFEDNYNLYDTSIRKRCFAKCLGKFCSNMTCSTAIFFILYLSAGIFSSVFGVTRYAILSGYFIFGCVSITLYSAYVILANDRFDYKKYGIRLGWLVPFIILLLYIRIRSWNSGITMNEIIDNF